MASPRRNPSFRLQHAINPLGFCFQGAAPRARSVHVWNVRRSLGSARGSDIMRARDLMRLSPMRQKWPALFLLIIALAACSRPVSANNDDYVGEYIFTPVNADPGKFADFVILKKDHSAVEIRFSKNTGQVVTAETQWHLDPGLLRDRGPLRAAPVCSPGTI